MGWDVSRASIGRDGGIVYITCIVGLPGGFNGDGTVDWADLRTLMNNFGTRGGRPGELPAGPGRGGGLR